MCARSRRLIGIAVFVVVCSALSSAQEAVATGGEPPVIRKQVDEVNLTFTVTDGRGRFITGLTQNNFTILDDHQPPASVQRFQSLTEMPLRICVAFDASDSIMNYMKFQQEVAIAFLRRLLRAGVDEACLVKFATMSVLIQDFTGDIATLEANVRKMAPQGSTAVWDAVRFTSGKMAAGEASDRARRVMILITDGDDNASKSTFEEAVQTALRSEVAIEVVDTVGVNSSYDRMKRLASATGGYLWMGGRPKDLAKALAKIENSLRSQYFVAYKPSGELARGQFRKIQLKPVGHKGKLAYRTGYFVP